MARYNTNKSTLAYMADWDIYFNDGLRDGYRNQGQESILEKKFIKAYQQGYAIGERRAQKEEREQRGH